MAKTFYPGWYKRIKALHAYQARYGDRMQKKMLLDTAHKNDMAAVQAGLELILNQTNTNWPQYSEPA